MTHLALPDRPAWMVDAVCRGTDPNQFFPERGQNPVIAQAKAMCARCPVIEQCLTYALEWRHEDGVWGGLSARERKRLRHTVNRRALCEGCNGAFVTRSSSRRYCSEECKEASRRATRIRYERTHP